jgi:hypothetical protein
MTLNFDAKSKMGLKGDDKTTKTKEERNRELIYIGKLCCTLILSEIYGAVTTYSKMSLMV